MALSRASHISFVKASNSQTAGPHVTGSFTSVSSSLLVAIIGSATDAGDTAADYTVVTSGLTWTKRGAVDLNGGPGYWTKIQIWTAPVTTGGSTTVSVNHAVQFNTCQIHVVSYTGYDVASPAGATGTDTALEDVGTFNLSGSPASTSEVVAARFWVPTGGVSEQATPGTGWSELFDTSSVGSEGWGGLESQARGSSTSASVDWIDTTVGGDAFSNIGLAVEFKADAGGVPFNPRSPASMQQRTPL